MRLLVTLCAVAAATIAAAPALAAGETATGFVVVKDYRTHAVTEVRDAYTGRVVSSELEQGGTALSAKDTACGDKHSKSFTRWTVFEPYRINVASIPSYLDRNEAAADLRAAHAAWTGAFTTDCATTPGPSHYRAIDGGVTAAPASLLDGLTTDGLNVVEFRSLAGTICDGALACTVTSYKGGKTDEADVIFEPELARYGFDDVWTTGDTTFTTPTRGEFAIVDVATHEWGHFAGLGHVKNSPELTMYPAIRDGMQTLGLGDMLGIAKLY
jgi:hypothetical protein